MMESELHLEADISDRKAHSRPISSPTSGSAMSETCLNGGLAKERGHRDLSGQCRLGKEVEVAFDTEISNRSGKIQAVNRRLV
jgi:hypothetical protein